MSSETREQYQCETCGISYLTNVHEYLVEFKASHEAGFNHVQKSAGKK